tara:strand:- start:209 stop:406 length:198 start_codon:yes stop_codon:yes gene_type:complete
MVNLNSGIRAPVVPESKRKTQETEYFEAVEEYGEEEAIHYLADLWGESIHRVKDIIERIGDDIWL